MFSLVQLRQMARDKLRYAVVLGKGKRYDGALYLCGYAVEIALKSRIVQTLGWADFPDADNEWKKHHKFIRTHELELLVKWSGCEVQLSNRPLAPHWNRMQQWTPETRYKITGATTRSAAEQAIRSARILVNFLCPL